MVVDRQRVARALNRLRGRSWPEKIVVDNGPKLRRRILDRWAYQTGIKLHPIERGTPMQTGCRARPKNLEPSRYMISLQGS